jgi:hypothetical protein
LTDEDVPTAVGPYSIGALYRRAVSHTIIPGKVDSLNVDSTPLPGSSLIGCHRLRSVGAPGPAGSVIVRESVFVRPHDRIHARPSLKVGTTTGPLNDRREFS